MSEAKKAWLYVMTLQVVVYLGVYIGEKLPMWACLGWFVTCSISITACIILGVNAIAKVADGDVS